MKTIFDKSIPGKKASILPESDVPVAENLPEHLINREPDLPELSEREVVRHYTNLSRKNFGVDNGFYPLGSCTMKYNPKINERTASLAGFTETHPYMPEELVQGNLELMHELTAFLCEITGMEEFTLQPAAGAHGELTGLMMIKSYFRDKKENRTKIITPDSSHGTNPASVTMCGFTPVAIKSNPQGLINLEALEEAMTEDVAALMLTNPNTLGLFEKDIEKIAQIVHSKGGLLYCDGANANAVLGISRFGDTGYDVLHLNLHKTFSTPHGCGGPGAGPVGVNEKLKPYLPGPVVKKAGDRFTTAIPEKSIGRVKAYFGNFGILVRAYAYIRSLGKEGIPEISRSAVLNANYMKAKLEKHFHMTYKQLCKHEFILDDSEMPEGVTTLDIAKRLLDHRFHPPTIYFPLIVKGAIMIEPTETETKEELDRFIEIMIKITEEAAAEPQTLKKAPLTTPVFRLDEVSAARKPVIIYETDKKEK